MTNKRKKVIALIIIIILAGAIGSVLMERVNKSYKGFYVNVRERRVLGVCNIRLVGLYCKLIPLGFGSDKGNFIGSLWIDEHKYEASGLIIKGPKNNNFKNDNGNALVGFDASENNNFKYKFYMYDDFKSPFYNDYNMPHKADYYNPYIYFYKYGGEHGEIEILGTVDDVDEEDVEKFLPSIYK